jgi:hypothetical protein
MSTRPRSPKYFPRMKRRGTRNKPDAVTQLLTNLNTTAPDLTQTLTEIATALAEEAGHPNQETL